ncbi:uncharacterized protein AB675_3013 [Cyphellophora attinorum]|uniref:Uncharacterized protein n=1 Tax=Cyphellophora attinorum TaxID=1664694 RepID=A0A0N1HLN6_9EURO|nr:uncharacterized protein AB675_3013 [Phialophora attinorum]KPI37985.1 hypothetical protein AB675_3013 [Phialophora attinorum]
MATRQHTTPDILELLKNRTTYTQFAQGFKDLRSVAFNTAVSAQTQIRAQAELKSAGRRGIEWFAKFPAVASSSSGRLVLQDCRPQLLRDMASFIDLMEETNAISDAYLRELYPGVFSGKRLGGASGGGNDSSGGDIGGGDKAGDASGIEDPGQEDAVRATGADDAEAISWWNRTCDAVEKEWKRRLWTQDFVTEEREQDQSPWTFGEVAICVTQLVSFVIALSRSSGWHLLSQEGFETGMFCGRSRINMSKFPHTAALGYLLNLVEGWCHLIHDF